MMCLMLWLTSWVWSIHGRGQHTLDNGYKLLRRGSLWNGGGGGSGGSGGGYTCTYRVFLCSTIDSPMKWEGLK